MRPLGKVTVNGVEYASPEAMPSEIREKYERAMAEAKVLVKQKIVVNGKEYASRAELPQGMRQVLDEVLGPRGDSPAGYTARRVHRKVRSAVDTLGVDQTVAKSYPWSLILALLATVALLAALWLSGVSPASLLRRWR